MYKNKITALSPITRRRKEYKYLKGVPFVMM
jgi:hypothetical protein